MDDGITEDGDKIRDDGDDHNTDGDGHGIIGDGAEHLTNDHQIYDEKASANDNVQHRAKLGAPKAKAISRDSDLAEAELLKL